MRSFESIREEIIDDEEREQMIEIEGEDDMTLLADVQYWSDKVWFDKGTYPTKAEFYWFKNLSLKQRYILINGEK